MKFKVLVLFLPLVLACLPLTVRSQDVQVLTPEPAGGSAPAPVLPEDEAGMEASGGSKPGASSGGLSIMTAEKGDEILEKIAKLQDDQKKILEALAALQKEVEFIKVSTRVR